MFATIRAYWSQFITAFVPRLLWTAFKFAQPFLINTTIQWVEVDRSQTSRNTGYGLIAAYTLVYGGLALSQALYWQNTYRFIVMVRGGLISMIFQKTMKVNPTDKMRHEPMVLMGTDIEKIALSLRQVHEVWASIIEIAIALWLLEKQMGSASIAPAVLTVGSSLQLSLPSHWLISIYSVSSRDRQIVGEDECEAASMDGESSRKTRCHLQRLSRYESHQASWSQQDCTP